MIGIVGSRNFTDYPKFEMCIDKILAKWNLVPQKIVSGGARGADSLAEKYATAHGYEINNFPADWEKFGKSAGFIRNKQIVEAVDYLIAFPSQQGKGTQNTIDLAKQKGIPIYTIWID